MERLTNQYVEAHKTECCGCHACLNVCPTHAISMREDNEGFLYPLIDDEKCIHCGQCAKVCQMINLKVNSEGSTKKVYACMSLNTEERLKSSSGGIFIQLARYVIEQGGCVFGAAFDDQMVVRHMKAHTLEECRKFMGSKYVQSAIGTTFAEAKCVLDQGEMVLFTGTPCQIHGLKLFLKKDYENLITADVVCHGVPTPKVLCKYIKEFEKQYNSSIENIEFRNKTWGWRCFSMKMEFLNGRKRLQTLKESAYMKGFLENLYLRESCYSCSNREGNFFSDITLGDYWGVEQRDLDMYDNQGTSIVLIHTIKGQQIFEKIADALRVKEVDMQYVMQHNHCVAQSVDINPQRADFFKCFDDNSDAVCTVISQFCHWPSRWVRFRDRIRHMFK